MSLRARGCNALFPALLSVTVLSGCGEGLTVPAEPASVEGTVLFWVTIPQPPGTTPGVSIRLGSDDPVCTDITVHTAETPERFVKRLPDRSLQPAGEGDLEEGQPIRAWTPGPVGCPFDGSASIVEIEVHG